MSVFLFGNGAVDIVNDMHFYCKPHCLMDIVNIEQVILCRRSKLSLLTHVTLKFKVTDYF
jgi:hypothetical protein